MSGALSEARGAGSRVLDTLPTDMSMLPSDRLVPSDCVVTRVVNGSTVLLNTDTGRYFTLDEVGGRAWTVLTSSPSIQEAREQLLAEYAVEPAELMRDLDTLIASLTEQGLVEVGRG
jgi:hypothetical protein